MMTASNWNIANAKQQLSEVVRLSAVHPQAICRRDKPVAVVISTAEFEYFQQLKAKQIVQQKPSVLAQFATIRALLAEKDQDGREDGFELMPRVDRANVFADDIDEVQLPLATAPT